MKLTINMEQMSLLREKYAYGNSSPIRNANQMINTKTVEVEHIDDIVIETAKEHWEQAISMGADFELGKLLEKKLCSFGGEILAYDYDDYAQIILNEGQLWYGDEIYYEEMAINNCHDNIIKIHKNNPNAPIVVGYALSEYGFWYSHTWSLKKDDDGVWVLETTRPSVLYYGVVLPSIDAEYFIKRYYSK